MDRVSETQLTVDKNCNEVKKKRNESDFKQLPGTYSLNWPGEPPGDGEMSDVTVPSRHRIRNSNPGGLRPSTLPLGHGGSSQY